MGKPYYVYYDKKTKAIISVTNEKNPDFEDGIEVEFEDIKNFLEGNWHFKDYIVDYLDSSTKLAVMSKDEQSYIFRNSEFEWIIESDGYSEFVVEWDGPNKSWNFSLEESFRKTYNVITSPRLIFFVTLESDFDFLVRTIIINTEDIVANERVIVPFETDLEHDIKRISISSKLVFKNYKLVVYE